MYDRRHLLLSVAAVGIVGCRGDSSSASADIRGSRREKERGRKDRGDDARPEPSPAPKSPDKPPAQPAKGGAFASPSRGEGPKVAYTRGDLNRLSYRWNEETREAAVYVPSSYTGAAVPLVLAIHGQGQDYKVMAKENGWARVCEERGWIGVFPNVGEDHNESDPRSGDHDFVMDTLQTVLRDLAVDRQRIFGAGFSGGCKKTYRLAARESHLFAAIGVSGGKMGMLDGSKDWDPRVTGAQRVSVLHIHGERDEKVPMSGSPTERNETPFVPTLEGLKIWADHDGCATESSPKGPGACPPRVWTRRWDGKSGHVVWGVFDPELKHQWSGYGTTIIADFFESVPRRA